MPETINLHAARRDLTLQALNSRANKTQAAIALGVSRPTLRGYIKEFGIIEYKGKYYMGKSVRK
jgi:DNA-binding protein Fis